MSAVLLFKVKVGYEKLIKKYLILIVKVTRTYDPWHVLSRFLNPQLFLSGPMQFIFNLTDYSAIPK